MMRFLHKFRHLNHKEHHDHPLNFKSVTSAEVEKFFKKYGSVYPEELASEFGALKTVEPEKLSLVSTGVENRRNHLSVFSSLLDYLRDDLQMINAQQSELFKNLIRKESEPVLSAYEVFLKTHNLEDFVETLFIIFE